MNRVTIKRGISYWHDEKTGRLLFCQDRMSELIDMPIGDRLRLEVSPGRKKPAGAGWHHLRLEIDDYSDWLVELDGRGMCTTVFSAFADLFVAKAVLRRRQGWARLRPAPR